MSIYRAIPDQTLQEAGQVIKAALGTGERTEFEALPGFDAAVAGTAIALAEGAPNAFFKGHGSSPQDYLTEGREEWRHFQTAVARTIDQHRSGGEVFETTGDVMRHIAGDVLQQAESRDIVIAATNTHPAFSAGLSESALRTVEYVRDDPEALQDAKRMAAGLYEDLPGYTQRDISSGIMNGDHMKQPVDDRIARFEELIDKDLVHVPGRERAAALQLGDFRDFGKPLFNEVEARHIAHASALVEGREKPWGYAEQAVVAHAASMEAGHVERVNGDQRIMAYARELANASERTSGYESISHSAARIEADIRLQRHYILEDARMPVDQWANDTSSLSAQVAESTPYRGMSPENQVEVFTQIHSTLRVPGLAAMRMAIAGEDVEKGDLLIGQAKEMAERKVTFEGIEQSERASEVAADMFLPGDLIRLDPTRRIVDFDHVTAKAKLGEDPLIVTKSIVEGVDMPNGMGGAMKGMRTSYELAGVEGRFPSQAFQHEHGENHEYGVLALEAGRLWFVPMDPGTEAGEPKPTGAAREVTEAKMSQHVGSLETMKDIVKDGPGAGEFVTIPEAFGRKEGPVELVGAPWWSDASKQEAEAARNAIREAQGPSAAVAMGARQTAMAQSR